MDTMRPAWLLPAFLAAHAFAQVVPLSGFSDEGTFFLYFNEERAGRITFHWKADGNFEGKAVLTGEASPRTLAIAPDAEGRWVRAIFDGHLGKTVVERQ